MRIETLPLRWALGVAACAAIVGRADAQCGTADSFEDNDDCSTAATVPTGTQSGLTCQGPGDPGGDDKDFYEITVPDGDLLTVDVLHTWATTEDLDSYLYDSSLVATCGDQTNYLDRGYTSSDNETMSWANATGSAVDVTIEVSAWTGGATQVICDTYDLVVSLAPDPCQAGTDDTLEENDTCGMAVPLALGAHTGLFVSSADEDFYTVNVPAGEIFTADVTYVSGANADVDLRLFDDLACTNEVDFSFSFGGTGTVEWANGTGAAATVVLKAEPDTATGDCNDYDLNLSSAPDPCLDPLADDTLEDNDDCSSPTPMNDGLTTDLFVSKADEDFYEVQVADGDMLTVDLFFIDATADVDLYLYDDQVACGDLTSYLVRGFTATDDESISWTNGTGSLETYWIQVVVYSGSTGDCNDYDMQIAGSGGVLAQPFCLGDGTADVGGGPVACPCGNESSLGAGEGCESSLGMGAILTATGTSIVANDDLVFTITQARANQPSLLIQGVNQVAFPFKDGILCMGTPTERIEVVFLDAAGEGSTTSSIVTEGNVTPGDTRYYQQWYRDPGGVSPCGTGSNFTGGLTVVWQ